MRRLQIITSTESIVRPPARRSQAYPQSDRVASRVLQIAVEFRSAAYAEQAAQVPICGPVGPSRTSRQSGRQTGRHTGPAPKIGDREPHFGQCLRHGGRLPGLPCLRPVCGAARGTRRHARKLSDIGVRRGMSNDMMSRQSGLRAGISAGGRLTLCGLASEVPFGFPR
jgi:hypothetical protein